MATRTTFRRVVRPVTMLAAIALPVGMLTGLVGSSAPADAATTTLAQAFDNVGITTTATASAGDYDGTGDSFSAAGLAADALSPGRTLLHDGLAIRWPGVAPGQPDNVVADGQTIAISGSGSTLGVVGSSAHSRAHARAPDQLASHLAECVTQGDH
jgi:hypothetical protein